MPIYATQEQLAFCKEVWEGRPCWLSARAGTGKTSTIKMVFDQAPTKQDCTVIAFNKKNQEDLNKALGLSVRVATLHSLGFAALRQFMSGLTLQNSKLFELTKTEGIKGRNAKQKFSDTMRLVSCAKNWGIIPARPKGKPALFKEGLLPDSPETWLALQDHFELWEADLEAARNILQRSNEEFFKNKLIDFDDMVYLPVALGLQVFTTSKMIVDEAQDLSPLNLKMLSRTPAKIWYVGDPFQCIYSWRGASEDALKELALPELPLTTCWRCSQAVIKEAQKLVPDIKAAPQAEAGTFQRLSWMPDWSKHKAGTILSRSNAALINIALQMRARNQTCFVYGRDLLKTLLEILSTFKGNTQRALLAECQAWQSTMSEKFPHRMSEFKDYSFCLQAFIQECHGKAQIEKKMESLFTDKEQEGSWLLSTIHKAKGLEWPTVWILDWTGKNLNQPWQKREDRNLRYVAITRAKQDLRLIEESAWNPAFDKTDWREIAQ